MVLIMGEVTRKALGVAHRTAVGVALALPPLALLIGGGWMSWWYTTMVGSMEVLAIWALVMARPGNLEDQPEDPDVPPARGWST